MGHEAWHEPYESLTPETRDMHRAIVSLMEELEAVDWYQQRADVTPDGERFLMLRPDYSQYPKNLVLVHQWPAEIQR